MRSDRLDLLDQVILLGQEVQQVPVGVPDQNVQHELTVIAIRDSMTGERRARNVRLPSRSVWLAASFTAMRLAFWLFSITAFITSGGVKKNGTTFLPAGTINGVPATSAPPGETWGDGVVGAPDST